MQAPIDACRIRDVPSLQGQLRALQRRCRDARPDGRRLARLLADIEQSRAWVEQRRRAAPVPRYPLALPVVEKRQAILEAIDANQAVILCGETGSGKTTQLPKICLELGRGTRGKIGHTQPRRIAARSLAARIAEELGSPLGEEVGYKVRFQDRVQERSYVKVMTDGILLAEIQADPELRQYDTLIIDEAHERSLNIDFLLGCLHRLLPRRPDLKLIITSATINPERFSAHFGGAPIIEVSGRTYPVETRYRPLQGDDEDQKDRSRGQAILDAVDELSAEGPGDLLVFLPGERAIRETAELLRKHHPQGTEILPLYARLSASQQARVFRPHAGRRVVLATNVAETSLTVPGIRYVVDTGLARLSRYCYRTKVQRLPIEPVSQASASQRAGRCGRLAAGVCIRLYGEDDFEGRSEFTQPEIQRTNLASVILQMAALRLGRVEAFPFVDPPDARLVRDGYKLLHELGAVDDRQELTPLGREIARLPIDPRLARMVLAAREQGCLTEVLIIVAALEVVDPRERPLDQAQAADEKHALFRDERSDFLAYVRLWNLFQEQARHLSQNKLRKWCREHFLSYPRMREWMDLHRQLQTQVREMGTSFNQGEADYRAIHSALLTGLLGNLAFQAEPGVYLGARNLRFALFPGSGLVKSKPKWLMAAELVETGKRYLRIAAAIQPGWVEPLAGHLVRRHYLEPHWEKKRAQVVAFERVTLYGLPLVARRKVNFGPLEPGVARELFIRHALVRGEFRTRAEFATHNRALLAELGQLEARARRRDLLVDDQELYRFFDARVPAEVFDGPGFERWWKQIRKAQPRLLHLERDRVTRHDAEGITAQRYPNSLSIRGIRLPLRYRFAPGDADDGLCVRLPLAALNQLRPGDFARLVPGLLREKLTLLIKSLPKQWRRHFVPAPDYADACMAAVQQSGNDLIDALSAQLQRMTGIAVPPEAWRPELLPSHLSAFFEVCDQSGKPLGSGRDLLELQQRLGDRAQQRFTGIADARYQRRKVEDWDFDRLPELVELEQDGVRLRGYPALATRGQGVELRLCDDPEQAVRSHREGLLALFRSKAGRVVKEIRRVVPELQKQKLWFSPIAAGEALEADLERAVLQAVFLEEGDDIRDAQSFQRRLDAGRPRLVPMAAEIGRWSFEALQASQDLKRLLKAGHSPEMIAAVGEVREQLDNLVYPGFLAATPLERLPHLARYIRAALLRLQKLPGNVERDRRNAAIVRRHEHRYRQAIAGQEGPKLDEIRWMIEELRVSLFAQELGTVGKISPERLERAWERLG
ncbi:MAG: ATP-dependent RNA helicase HrpA [Gammaproteobacteria bacterium]